MEVTRETVIGEILDYDIETAQFFLEIGLKKSTSIWQKNRHKRLYLNRAAEYPPPYLHTFGVEI